MVNIWYVRTAEVVGKALVDRFEAILDEEERERLGAFRFDRHRHEYLGEIIAGKPIAT